jgi:hypothetical protein
MLVEQVRHHRLRGHMLYVWRNTTAVHRRPGNDAVRRSGRSRSDDAIHGGDAHHPRSFTVRAWLIGLLVPSVHSCTGAGTCVIVMSRWRASFVTLQELTSTAECGTLHCCHIRGRARSGHSLAANCANSFGQVYVAVMAGWIGCGPTMVRFRRLM